MDLKDNIDDIAKGIRLVLFDVDGVLTDGGIYIGPQGEAFKRFDVHDGMGIQLLKRAGLMVGIVSGSQAPAALKRAQALGMHIMEIGVVDKGDCLNRILQDHALNPHEIAYMGDDLVDAPIMVRIGLAVAPANARPEIKALACHHTKSSGGRGAVREFCDWFLERRGVKSLDLFLDSPSPLP